MIIDTHAHYDDSAFDGDRDQVLTSLPAQNVEYVVNMGADLEGCRKSAALSERYPFVYCGIGLHPDHVGLLMKSAGAQAVRAPGAGDVYAELYELARNPKCVCIGEIGLDYHWMVEEKEVQKAAFIEQIHMAQELGLPFNVHSRNAAQDTFDIIREEDHGRAGGIIHCFSGSREMAREYVKMGYFLGIGGAVTFKNSKTLRKVVADIPIEYLVTETDSPYMTPEPYRGRRNTSANIRYVIDEIAAISEMDVPLAEEILNENARRVYGRLPR